MVVHKNHRKIKKNIKILNKKPEQKKAKIKAYRKVKHETKFERNMKIKTKLKIKMKIKTRVILKMKTKKKKKNEEMYRRSATVIKVIMIMIKDSSTWPGGAIVGQ